MKKEQLEKLKGLLLEALIMDGELRKLTYIDTSVAKGIRKIIRDSLNLKPKEYPKMIIEKNDLEPAIKGEKTYWFTANDPKFSIVKDKLIFQNRPWIRYHMSDYRITIGEQWLLNILHKKDEVV